MPSGFMGEASRLYIGNTEAAMSSAAGVNSQNPAGARRAAANNREHPFPLDEANSGRIMTGVGNSSNIVVDSITYYDVLNLVDRIDDDMGELFYQISNEIEEMCSTTYIVPRTVERCTSICGSVKNSLGNFRSLTDENAVATRRFVGNILNII